MTWLHDYVRFEQPALEATLADYVHEVHHAGERIAVWRRPLTSSLPRRRANSFRDCRLQALRGVAQMTAVTIVAETGSLSRSKILVS